jgi:hypothetical protein
LAPKAGFDPASTQVNSLPSLPFDYSGIKLTLDLLDVLYATSMRKIALRLPVSYLVQPLRIELSYSVLQTGAMTTLAQVALFGAA